MMKKTIDKKVKKILVVSQYFYPEEFRINDMSKEWIKRGYQVTVLTGIPNYPQGKFYNGYGFRKKRHEIWNGIEIIRIPIISRGHNFIRLMMNYMSFVVSGYFWGTFTKVKADYVFVFGMSPITQALCGIHFAKRRKIPCDVYVQDLWPESVQVITGLKNKTIISLIERMVKYIYKKCRYIYATSESFVGSINKRVDDNKEKVIYWPQYAEDFYYPVDLPEDNSEQILKIMFTGNIGQAQGLEILPETAAILKEQKLIVKFILIGDGRNRIQLQKRTIELNVEEYFEFREKIPPIDISKALGECDLAFISFMNTEIFSQTIPAKLQTYLACAKPILASAAGETEKIINEAQCGFNSKIGEPEALADKILEIIEMDKNILKKMGINGKKYCDENFNKNHLMDLMDEFIQQN